jgi:hypothetical protein
VLNAIISPETYQALDRRAARQAVTRSEVIREILADFLDDHPGPVEPKPFYRDKDSKTLNFAVTEEMRDGILDVVERSAGERSAARMKISGHPDDPGKRSPPVRLIGRLDLSLP